MLVSVHTMVGRLEAQEAEGDNTPLQEFIDKAQSLVKLNRLDEAIDIYERIVIATPTDDDSLRQLAFLYLRTNQHEKAVQAYSKLLEFDSENISYQDRLVSCLQAAGKHREALELAQSYIQTDPTVGEHYTRLGRFYELEGNNAAALTAYKKASELEPGDKQIYLKLARLNFLNEKMDAVEIALKDAILSAPSESQQQGIERQLISLYRYQGNLIEKLQEAEDNDTITFQMQKAIAEYYHESGEFEKATKAYMKARDMATDSYDIDKIYTELLKVYVQLEDIYAVIEPYEVAADSYRNSDTLIFTSERIAVTTSRIAAIYKFETERDLLIDAFKSQDKLEVLKAHYEDEFRENKENLTARIILARIYWDGKDYQKSSEMYESLANSETNNIRYFYYAAAAFKRNKQPELSKEMLNQGKVAIASSSEKDDTWFLGSLATICIENRMFESAIDLSKSAIEMSDDERESRILDALHGILAKSYRETKQYEEALDIYQQMASGEGYSSIRNMAKNAIREISKEANLYEELLSEQLKNVEENPNNPKLIQELAESYEAVGKIKEAIEQYEKLAVLQPQVAQWFRILGDLYQKVDRKVVKVIEDKALSLDGDGSYVEIVDSEIINNISDQVTISAWIKPTDFPNTCTTVLFKGNERTPDLSHRQFALWVFDEGLVYFDASPNGNFIRWIASANESIQKNQWYHIAGTIDAKNNNMKLYLNGDEVSRSNFKGETKLTKTTLPLRIGTSHEEEISEHASFAGLIDEVRVWNIVRTESQIRSDMNKQLNGDEAGLVGYWKFDAEIEGRVSDSSLYKHDGRLVRNAKIEPYNRQVLSSLPAENFTKAESYYERAIELRPTAYQYYGRLAKLYIDQNQISDAVDVYLRGLDVPLGQAIHDTLIHAIYELCADEDKKEKCIAILEEVEPKLQENTVLYELLGDLYKKLGDAEKAENAYAKWLKLREQRVSIQSAEYQRWLAEKLLNKDIFPDTTLKYASRALLRNTEMSYDYPMTLGHAYVVNDRYDDALKYYKYALSMLSAEDSIDHFLKNVENVSKNETNKERSKQMLEALRNSIPRDLSNSMQIFID